MARIVFVQNNALDESQALIELAAWLRNGGHECTLLLDREERDLGAAADQLAPDLAVVACSMLNHSWARDAATRLRQAIRAPIVAGGTGPTLFPRLLRGADIDWLIRGEAERPMDALLSALGSGLSPNGIAGLFQWRSGKLEGTDAAAGIDMVDMPHADKGIYYDRYPFMRAFPFKRFLSSRGCHHRCTYCYIPALNKVRPREKGKRWTRRKTPEQAVEEVAREKALGPLSHVHFSDDLFTNDKQWLQRFAPLYRQQIGIPFTCNTSAEMIDDDVAAALAEAGCHAIGFAVETASARLRLKVLRKGVTTEHLHAAATALQKHGVRLATFNMMALPGETPNEALDTAKLNADLGTDFVRLNYAFPMPGTGMCDYAIKEGFLPEDWPEQFASPRWRYSPGPQFRTPFRREFENLFVLFRVAAKDKRMAAAVGKALGTRPPRAIHRLLTLQGAWNEKRTFRIPVVAGLKFFAKVGRPELRATNFPALI